MPIGQVIKTYNGFFYIKDEKQSLTLDTQLVSCRVRGRVKRVRDAVLTGDMVEYQLLGDGTGIIERCLDRSSLLQRPAVANINQVIITFAARTPDINTLLLNRFLVLAEWSGIENIVICINKSDLIEDEIREMMKVYESAGYRVVMASAKEGIGISELKELLEGRVTVFAGPSGVGKSSLLNAIDSSFQLATGTISDKIKRGKHTTRSACLLPIANGGIVVDTPGFSAADLEQIDKAELAGCFPEFRKYIDRCYYNTCTHSHEPDCAVKQAVENGELSQERYSAYSSILQTILDRKKAY